MKKKPPVKLKASARKPKKNRIHSGSTTAERVAANKAQPKVGLMDDPVFAQAVQNYETGLKALQQHKFERAQALLGKVAENGPRELADRARTHLNTCNAHLAHSHTSFKSPAEHYDYAVSLLNGGDYENARVHLEKILKQTPQADFAWYGMAVIDCLTGNSEAALRNLEQAVKLNAVNRFQARNDSDFQKMEDDPRFTELLYPENTVISPPEDASA